MAPRRGHAWLWGLALVIGTHLLTTPGTWIVTDQAESLFAATRLLDRGTLDLAAAGEPLPEVHWAPREAGQPVRSRLLPGVAVVLAPLLFADRALGLDRPVDYGRIVNLQGHLCVFAALGCLGLAARRHGADDASTGLAVAVTGLTWHTWQISRRGGAEPLMAALVGLALLARSTDSRWRAIGTAAVLVLLPWINPAGSVLAASLVAALLVGPPRETRLRPTLAALGSLVLGAGSVIVLWNYGYHGSWGSGGYRLVDGRGAFGVVPLETGLGTHLSSLLWGVAPLILPALVLCRTAASRRWLVLPGWLLLSQLALFATYRFQEPERRLAVVLPAFGLALAMGLWRGRVSAPVRQALLVGSALLGIHWFFAVAGRYYQASDGLYYPYVLWVKKLIDAEPWLGVAAPVGAFVSLVGVSAARLWRLQERVEGLEPG